MRSSRNHSMHICSSSSSGIFQKLVGKNITASPIESGEQLRHILCSLGRTVTFLSTHQEQNCTQENVSCSLLKSPYTPTLRNHVQFSEDGCPLSLLTADLFHLRRVAHFSLGQFPFPGNRCSLSPREFMILGSSAGNVPLRSAVHIHLGTSVHDPLETAILRDTSALITQPSVHICTRPRMLGLSKFSWRQRKPGGRETAVGDAKLSSGAATHTSHPLLTAD